MTENNKKSKSNNNSVFFINSKENKTQSQSSTIKFSQIFEEVSKKSGIDRLKMNRMDEKSLDKTKLFKNLYTIDAGRTIQNLKITNKLLKTSTDIYKLEPTTNREQSFSNYDSDINFNQNYKKVLKHSRSNSSSFTNNLPQLNVVNMSKSNSQSYIFKNNSTINKFYCPCCSHCNKINEDTLDEHLSNIKDARNILIRALDYAVNTNVANKNNLDIFNTTRHINNAIGSYEINHQNHSEIITNFENFHNNFPKQAISKNRDTYLIVARFMNALVDDTLSLEHIATPDLIKKIEKFTLPRGLGFDQNEHKQVYFDEELESHFEPKTKEIIKKLLKKKYLASENENKEENEKKYEEILAEISIECKEKAVLLYKFFKLYFAEQEKKWITVINKMKQKIRYYKDLCKTIIHQKNKHLDKIEAINDILFSQKLTKENLSDHKKLIQDLLKIVNDKRDEIYMMKAEKEILLEELRVMVYDYDAIKLNKKLRDELVNFNMEKLAKNVNEEMKHKK